jgi:Imidazolonepropionase and related amidohydrolases
LQRVFRGIVLSAAVLLVFAPLFHVALSQTIQPAVVIIDGGVLIDGNGGPPVRDVQIVIQGNRIAAIGRKGQNTPPNAQVINADGKFILPGLWDGLDNFVWNQGEILLNNGVTSFIGIGDMGEVGVAYTEGVKRGKIRGPRPFDWPVHFVGAGAGAAAPGAGNRTGLESPFQSPHALMGPEDAREWVKRLLDLGASGISFQNGAVSQEIFKAAVETANAAGKPVGIRAGGARGAIGVRDAVAMGAGFLPRSMGVAAAVTSAAEGADELQQWADMDEAKAKDLIRILVERKTALYLLSFKRLPEFPPAGAGSNCRLAACFPIRRSWRITRRLALKRWLPTTWIRQTPGRTRLPRLRRDIKTLCGSIACLWKRVDAY